MSNVLLNIQVQLPILRSPLFVFNVYATGWDTWHWKRGISKSFRTSCCFSCRPAMQVLFYLGHTTFNIELKVWCQDIFRDSFVTEIKNMSATGSPHFQPSSIYHAHLAFVQTCTLAGSSSLFVKRFTLLPCLYLSGMLVRLSYPR